MQTRSPRFIDSEKRTWLPASPAGGRSTSDTERIPFRKPNFSFPFFLSSSFSPLFYTLPTSYRDRVPLVSPLVPVPGTGEPSSRKSNETENSTDENVARPGARLNILLLLVPGIGNDLNIPWNEATSPRSRSPPFHRNFISVEINRVALPLSDCSS